MTTDVAMVDKAEIEQFRAGGSTSIDEAKRLATGIKDAPSLDLAAKFMLAAKDRLRRVTERLRGPKEDARRAWKNWCDLETELTEPYQRIEREILKPAMARFQAEQDRVRREEENRLRAEAKKREEDARLRDAAALERDGQKELANAILDAPVIVPPVVLPRMETPVGISYRDVWKFEIADLALIPREYLTIDEKKIGAVVRAMKNETNIAGIRVYREMTVAGRV